MVVPRRRSPPTGGFTLLEMVLAMFVFALMVSAVFTIANGTTQLADETEKAHEREAQSFSFAHFCDRMFRELPARAMVRLRVEKADRQYTSQLAILNAPSVLNNTSTNGLTVLESEPMPGGNLRVNLRLVAARDISAYENGKKDVGEKLTLLENVVRLEWRVFDKATNDWATVWNKDVMFSSPATPVGTDNSTTNPSPPAAPVTNGLRPSLVDLALSVGADKPRHFMFWAPPAELPITAGQAAPAGAANPPPLQNPPPQR